MNKIWRIDIGFWEEQKTIFRFINYYKYTIFKNGKLKKKIRFFKIKSKSANYFKFRELSPIVIGKKELNEEYNGNKWNVPTNIIFDQTKD